MWQSVLRSAWFVLVVIGAPLMGATSIGAPLRAQSWDDIGNYSSLLRRAGTQTLVAKDCPPGLFGAFHAGRNALLMCSNNLRDDPAQVWTVLAHESAHVMQHCQQGPLLPDHQIGSALAQIEKQSLSSFQELRLYHPSQRRDEIEARLVQELPMAEVKALFREFCGDRLRRRAPKSIPSVGLVDG
jgi:hypothetical protein